jgi:hypothetical protein
VPYPSNWRSVFVGQVQFPERVALNRDKGCLQPEHVPGFFALARMQFEIEAVVGRPVDLRTPKDLSRYFRDDVLRSAEVQYSAV